MGFFGTSKPKVTKEEFYRAVTSRMPHLNGKERRYIMEFFEDDVDERASADRGLDAEEITNRIESLRATKDMHHLSDPDIDEIENALKSML